jgi:predicted phosphate transport protein (TIGR00153 family)
MLGWFRALMPKEERFFDLFSRHARVTLAAAQALTLLNGDDDVIRCCREITKRENEADEITREVLTALRKTFITPLDRGDIKDLITSMDDSIDQMNQTAKVITLFELRSFETCMQEMGEAIVQAAKLMVEAVSLLSSLGRQSARLNSLTEEMIRLEEQVDQLHDHGRKQLFRPCSLLTGELPDPIRVVSTIREQHRLWKQDAEENRTQPVIMRFTGREGEMDRQAIGVHHRVNLAGQAPS